MFVLPVFRERPAMYSTGQNLETVFPIIVIRIVSIATYPISASQQLVKELVSTSDDDNDAKSQKHFIVDARSGY